MGCPTGVGKGCLPPPTVFRLARQIPRVAQEGCPTSRLTGIATSLPAMDLHTGSGLEDWRTVGKVKLTRWDLWYLMILVRDCGNSWDTLGLHLRKEVDEELSGFRGLDWEAKRSHMEALRKRLESASADPAKLLGKLVESRPILYKARDRLLKRMVPDAYKTPDMVATPRLWMRGMALRGLWFRFPVSPRSFEKVYASEINQRDFYGETASLRLSDRLEERLKRAAKEVGGDAEKRLALYRAGLTAVLDGVERVDDSFGVIGQFYQDVLSHYFDVPWTRTSIEPEVYYRDFLNLATWEDYGFMHGELAPFFRAVPPDHVPLVETILGSIRKELLLREELTHQVERAGDLLNQLHQSTQKRVLSGASRGSGPLGHARSIP